MDANSFATVVGVLSAAGGALLAWIGKGGVDAWLKLRADHREDVKLEDQKEQREETKQDNDLRFIIGRQDGELASLRNELKEVHLQHNDCEKKHAALATELRVRMELMNARVDHVETDMKAANKQIEDNRKGDSKVILEVHTPHATLPDGTEITPEDVAFVKAREESKRAHDAKHEGTQ